jgi:uncharacterized protein (DUF433 family)
MIGVMSRPPFRGRPWGPADRAGGVLDAVLDELRVQVPDVVIERYDPWNKTEDDNLYFVGDSTAYELVLINTNSSGGGPLLIESDYDPLTTEDVEEAVAYIRQCLADSHDAT